ncbi:MAG: JAB domain-containing protein [Bacteroidota bacterium]
MKNSTLEIVESIVEGPGVASLSIYYEKLPSGGPTFDDAEEMAKYFRSKVLDEEYMNTQEQMFGAYFDSFGRLLFTKIISMGTRDECPAPYAPIIRPAIVGDATGVVLVHNHPEGPALPSSQDIKLANAVGHALDLCQIEFADFLIINRENHQSLKELDLLYE